MGEQKKLIDLTNCCWTTSLKQNRNRRNNRVINAFGETRVLQDWVEALNIPRSYIYLKMKLGLSLEDIVRKRGENYGGVLQ